MITPDSARHPGAIVITSHKPTGSGLIRAALLAELVHQPGTMAYPGSIKEEQVND
jgi:hypothetical protein